MLNALATLALIATSASPASGEASAPFLCLANETTVFAGEVEDDFGFSVGVCTSGERENRVLTIRWSGEGGGGSVSCTADVCEGTIEYSRYTSPHLTILQLAWCDGDSVQRLYQTLERADFEAPAQSETRHSWQPAGVKADQAITYPVVSDGDPLALMQLETVIEVQSSTGPLLAKPQL